MPVLIALAVLVLITLLFLPQIWTQHVFRRYSGDIPNLPGTGGDLARHLIESLNLADTRVSLAAENSDYYDPASRTIALSPPVHDGKSLTAVVIAAHEIGHALQHQQGYRPLTVRWHMAGLVVASEKIASLLLLSLPLVVILTRIPVVGGVMLVSGLGILSLPVMFHLITLPVELDASFNRALPLLEKGRYLPKAALPAARRILMAAAFTYVATSLASLLNFYRWIAILRR